MRSPSRRALLFGRVPAAPLPPAFRPPWGKPEPEFLAACTRCDACVHACPEQVLVRDADGLPRFDAQAGECTFCGDCVAACGSGAAGTRPNSKARREGERMPSIAQGPVGGPANSNCHIHTRKP